MTMTSHERRQLELIGRSLTDEDPVLACKLSRMSPVSLQAVRMAAAALGVLTLGSALLVVMGLTMRNPLYLVFSFVEGGAVLLGLVCCWLCSRRQRSMPAGSGAGRRSRRPRVTLR
ncbi:MAG: DUF3040 domain-containing protein [Sciscionella sp.]